MEKKKYQVGEPRIGVLNGYSQEDIDQLKPLHDGRSRKRKSSCSSQVPWNEILFKWFQSIDQNLGR